MTDFRLESATLTVEQRLALRKLFQQAGVASEPNDEATAARGYLDKLKSLAREAGGEPPLPAPASTLRLQELSGLSGNEQLVALYIAEYLKDKWGGLAIVHL